MHEWQQRQHKENLDLLEKDPIKFFKNKIEEKNLNGEGLFYDEERRAEFQKTIDDIKKIQNKPKVKQEPIPTEDKVVPEITPTESFVDKNPIINNDNTVSHTQDGITLTIKEFKSPPKRF